MDSMASLFSLVSAFPACPEAQTAAQAILRARKIQTQRSGADAMQSFSAQNTSGERARANKKP